MENVSNGKKKVPEHIQKMIEDKIKDKREFVRKVRAGELDFLKNNVISTI